MLRSALLVVALLLLSCVASANDVNTDGNLQLYPEALGPVSLHINFEYQIIEAPPFDSTEWLFTEDRDYAFEVDVPRLDKFYFLDFVTEEVFTFEDAIPDGWHPMMKTESDFSFTVKNLLGDSKPTVFLAWRNDLGVDFEYLEPGEVTAVRVNRPTEYYLLIDADAFGGASFAMDVNGYEVGVSVNFKQLPSVWEYVERFAMACSVDDSHRCLIIEGVEFDFDACVDKDSELNSIIGEGAPLDVCVAGPVSYREWRTQALIGKLESEQRRTAKLEERSDPELAAAVGRLESDIEDVVRKQDEDRNVVRAGIDEIIFGTIVILGAVFGIFVWRQRYLPIAPITNRIEKTFGEVKERVRQKKEGEGAEEEDAGDRGRSERGDSGQGGGDDRAERGGASGTRGEKRWFENQTD